MLRKKKDNVKKHEKIVELSVFLDAVTAKAFDFFILFFLFGGLFFLLIFTNSTYTQEEIKSYVDLTTYAFIIPSFIGMVFGSFTFFLSLLNISFRKYEIKEAIKDFFYELSEKPELKRRNKILKLLNFNLNRLRSFAINNGISLMSRPSMRGYNNYIKKGDLMKVEIIDRVTNLINDPTTYWLDFDYSNIFKKFGDAFVKKDYKTMLNIIEENKENFTQFDKFKNEFEKSKIGNKLKSTLLWISRHLKEILIFIIIVSYILTYLGIIPNPINIST